MAGKDAAKGPDNNKRLAFLEGRLSSVIAAVTAIAGRFAPDLELAPKDENEDLLDVQIRLLEEIATCETPCDRRIAELEAELAKGPNSATEGEIAAIARADEAEKKVAELTDELGNMSQDVEDLTAEKNRLANEVAKLNDVIASKGYAKPEIVDVAMEALEELAAPRERPEHARDFGPTFGQLDRAELGKLIEAGADFEIAFSNGTYELAPEPTSIKAADLVGVEGRFMVNPPIVIRGGDYREEIHGAALLHKGEQVAYCTFPSPIKLEAKQDRQFTRAILFG